VGLFLNMEALAKILINPLVLAVLYIAWRFVRGSMGRRHIVILFIYLYLVSIPFTSKCSGLTNLDTKIAL